MKTARQREIYRELSAHGVLSMAELQQRFEVSTATIRRDITALLERGLVNKVYGGVTAVPSSAPFDEPVTWRERQSRNREQKLAIARRAVELIEDGSTVALDVGSTVLELSHLLSQKRHLTVVTHSLRVAIEVTNTTTHQVYAVGGAVTPMGYATTGSFAREFLDHFSTVDLFLGGAEGISIPEGLTSYSEAYVEITKLDMAKARRSVILTDHSKFGVHTLFRVCSLDEIDVLVTDSGAPASLLEAIAAGGTEVLVAS